MIVLDSPAPLSRGRAVARLGPLVALAVGVPVALAVARHAWSVPTFDDYSYARDAYSLHDTGHFVLHGWGEMSRLGMLVAVQPFLWTFGDTLGALHAFGAVSLALFLLATYDLVAGLAGRGRALGATAVVAFCPQVPALTPSFMTDVPMLAALAGSATLGSRALRSSGRARYGWLTGALLLGLLAFTVREVGAAAPAAVIAVVAVEAFRRQHWPRLLPVALGVVGAVVAGGFELYRHSLAGDQAPGAPPGVLAPLVPVGWTVATLGLLLSPLLLGLLLARRLPLRPGPTVLPLVAVVVLDLALSLSDGKLPVPGSDTLDPRGAGTDNSIAGHPPVVLFALLVVLQVPALLGGAVLLAGLRRPRGQAAPAVLLVRLLLLAVLAASVPVLSTHWLDRYCLPVTWAATVVLLTAAPGVPWPRRAVVAAGVLVTLLGAAGLAVADEGFRVHAAEWSVGNRLVAQGYAPTEVDAGLEWLGYHADGAADLRFYGSTPGASVFAGAYRESPCVELVLTAAAVAGRPVTATYGWTDTLGGRRQVYVVNLRECRATPA